MRRIVARLGVVADRLLAPFLLAAILTIVWAYQYSNSADRDSTVRAAVEEASLGRLERMSLDRLNAPDTSGNTALMVAVMLDKDEIVARLLERGVDVNVFDDRGGTALIIAAYHGRAALVDLLLRHGAAPRVRTPFGMDALSCAVLGGDPECIAMLLRAGADPCDPRRRYSLISCTTSTGDRPDLVRQLVAAGVDPNRTGMDGVPPLMDLCKDGGPGAARALLELGADPGACDRDGRRARDVAASEGRGEVVRVLDEFKAGGGS